MSFIRLIAIAAAFFAGTICAGAHAQLDHASPAVGSIVQVAPKQVAIWFTGNLEPAFSKMEVYDSNSARVDQGKAQVDRAQPNILRVNLRSLPTGSYKVQWRVISVDTHTTEGSFSFHVRP